MEFCISCNNDVNVIIDCREAFVSYKGHNILYDEYFCACPICGNEIYHHVINDVNYIQRAKAIENYERYI